MGKIPEYQQASFRSSVQLSNIGDAATLGNAISRTAGLVQDYAAQQRQARDLAYVSSRSVDLETRATQRFQQWQNDHASDPLGKEDALQNSIQEDIEDLAKDAPTEDARASLQRMGDDVKRRMSVNGSQWANQQLVKNIGDELDRSSQTLQTAAFRSADPNQLDDLFKQHDTLLFAAKASLSPEAVKKMNEVGKREIVANTLEGMIDKDRLHQAKAMLDSQQYDQILGADNVRKGYELISRKMEQQRSLNDNLLALKDKHPWQYLAKVGETKAVQPLSFIGDDVQKTFAARERFTEDMGIKHAMQVPFVSPQEVDHLADQLLSVSSKDASLLLSNLAVNTTDKQKRLFGAQVFEKEPSIAAALMIAGDAPEDARKIVGGMSLMRNRRGGKPINPPKQSQIDQDFDSYLGNAVEDPAVRTAVKQAATAHMVQSMFETGSHDFEAYRSGDFQKSIEAVVGPVAEINGAKTVSFRKAKGGFYDADDLEDLVDGLNDQKVEQAQGDVPRTLNGQPINLKKARSSMTLKAVGDGAYWIYTPEGIALDKNQQPFVLNLKKIAAAEPAKRGFFSRLFGGSESPPATASNTGGAPRVGGNSR